MSNAAEVAQALAAATARLGEEDAQAAAAACARALELCGEAFHSNERWTASERAQVGDALERCRTAQVRAAASLWDARAEGARAGQAAQAYARAQRTAP